MPWKKFSFIFRPNRRIPYTDGIPQIIVEHILDRVRISCGEGRAEAVDSRGVRASHFPEPVLHQIRKQFLDLTIGNPQAEYVRILIRYMFSGQIAGRIKYAPHIFNAVVYITVSQFLPDLFCYLSSV